MSQSNGNFLILDTYGKVFSVGLSNQYGVLGIGFEGNKVDQPLDEVHKVLGLDNENVIDVQISSSHCLALTEGGDVYSWGLGLNGALGYELTNLEACQLIH